ncbi:transcriptional regulator [Bailinhaonella thermotolerans]|uniref:Transcriptional regulator n=1 Tax=Bailinhaonella thermotolerans TaxID=1070861 RepID=A0A3A4A589_9ACTN|nr:transcriptional regulator [Bailinhaonella thermotolerans]RJL22959.1 transcriptional regulator [Bailinhaonella thermotolerans]
MTAGSPPALLVLHAVRLSGFADTPVIARRYDLGAAETEEALLDAEAFGWVERTAFAGTAGWSLTERGRAENERLLAAELANTGGADEVHAVHREFLPLNALVLRACTDWQLRPAAGDRLAPNDHSDPAWDARVLRELDGVDRALAPLAARLESVLPRFRGYDDRFAAALARARAGEAAWVDSSDVDSCHRVWFELHEDLIATLGLDRSEVA